MLAHKDETGLRGACRHASRCRTEAVRAVFLLRTRGVKFGVLSVKNRDISKMGHKALGYTASANTPSPTVNVNVGLVSAETLEKARERAKESFGLRAEPTRAVASESPPIGPDAAMAEIMEE